MAKDFLWITKTEENLRFYSESAPKSDLALHFAPAIDSHTKKCICGFVRYLRKEFFFPVRCNVYFCSQEKFRSSQGGYCYGIFYPNDESSRMIYPQIYIPANNGLYSVYFYLTHELTHYFQWFFFDDKEKSSRSLEVQASRYADRISEDYCDYHCRETGLACKNCRGK